MAKNFSKKPTFSESGVFDGIEPQKPTHTHTHTHNPTHIPVVKERKTRRVQLLLKDSTVNALDAYAKSIGTSRNEIVGDLIEGLLNRGL